LRPLGLPAFAVVASLVPPAGGQEPPVEQGPDVTAADVLASLSWEPRCDQVLERALEAMVPVPSVVPTARRMRLSALLPRIRFTVEKNLEHDESLDSESDGDVKIGIDTDNDLEIRGYVQWDLADLVFHPSETSAASKKLDEIEWRVQVGQQVVSLYHERKKLLVLLGMGAIEDPVTRVEAAMRVEELTALLDAVTGGWFLEELRRRADGSAGGATSSTSSP
jgi:hypothetical protein